MEMTGVSSSLSLLVEELSGRIYMVEQRISGQVGILEQQQTIIDSLVSINTKMNELTGGRERFHQVYQSLEELEKVLNNPVLFDLEYDEEANIHLVLLEENRFKHEALLYREVDNLKATLDSDSLRNHESLVGKLTQIRSLVLNQAKEAERIESDTRELVLYHQKLTETINALLTTFDRKLKDLERAKKAPIRAR